jgi:hypothetical protein
MITDQQIDDMFGDSPFIARRKMDKTGYEVVQNTHPDWRTHIPNDGWVHHGYFASDEDAITHKRRLHVRFILANGPVSNAAGSTPRQPLT